MTPPQELIARFHAALPDVRDWIEELLGQHRRSSRSVNSRGYPRLPDYFPSRQLERARIVVVAQVPVPPLDRFGFPELEGVLPMSAAGITFKDTFFVREGQETESLCFHELVHVVQWRSLGVERFLLAYGVGLVQFGYAESPLEKMAYSLQASFDRGEPSSNLVERIEAASGAIWGEVESVIASEDER